ncbi:hypothetical protein EV426DRAFT_382362 [Tirmania nivea]|nr:hypothetical protein EV426DRAFT_382362 [Tirmania nivea]
MTSRGTKYASSNVYDTFAQAYQTQNGILAGKAFALGTSNNREFAYSTNNQAVARDVRNELLDREVFDGFTSTAEVNSWVEVFVCFWKVTCALERGDRPDAVKAWEAQKELVLAVIRGFQNAGWSNMFLPVLYMTSNNLRLLAVRADYYVNLYKTPAEQNQEKLEDAARVINRGFTICIADRAPIEESRKWGTYYMTNLLFKMHFKLNTIVLTKNILRAIQASAVDMPDITDFPKPQRITFWYYLGVVHFLEGKYEEAEENLMRAFEGCYQGATQQQELILMYLIPTRLLNKQLLPARALLSRYPRLEALFLPFAQCIKSGNLKKFDEALAAGEEEFVKRRIYLTLERCREVVLRNLFRKAYMCQAGDLATRSRVPLELFRVAVEVSSGLAMGEMEAEEVECLLANMIYSGRMKGYISREHSKMVFSSKDPFPGTKTED